jgi:hypothetical protein
MPAKLLNLHIGLFVEKSMGKLNLMVEFTG